MAFVKALIVASAFLACCASIVNAQTVTSPDALLVVDADGKRVGVGTHLAGGGLTIPLQVGDQLFAVILTSDGQRLEGSGSWLVFETGDCSSAAYYKTAPGTSMIPTATIGPPGRTAYIPDPAMTGKFIVPQSGSDNGSEGKCLTNVLHDEIWVTLALPMIDLAATWREPFRIIPQHFATAPLCPGDFNGDGRVMIDEIVSTVDRALNGCGSSQ